jgi:hypothetical protein
VSEGVLRIASKGAGSFIGVGAGLGAGTAKLSFRIRAPQAGEGKVTLLSSAGGTEMLAVPYLTSGEATWQTITVQLKAPAATGILRLYLPTGSAAVELDDIVLTPAQGAPRRWEF